MAKGEPSDRRTLLVNGDIVRSKVVDSPVISRFKFALKAGHKS